MAIGKKPAEVVGKIIAGNCLYGPQELCKLLQSDLIKCVETNPTQVVGKFIANTRDPRVYDVGELGKMVEYNLVYGLAKTWSLDQLYMLQEDENKDEVNRHDNYNREEPDGLNIPVDACKLTTHMAEDKENDSSDKFGVVYVKDEKMGVEYIAIDLIVDKLRDIHRNDMIIDVKLIDRLTITNEYTVGEVGDLIKKYEIRAPETNNKLSPTYRRNPLYKASKDPIKTIGDMHRDIRKNLFDHCHSELNSGRAKFPYGVFQLYTDTKPETCLKKDHKVSFKFNDPKVLQLVYYVNQCDQSHPGYLKDQNLQNLKILMCTMDMQNSQESPELISLQDAVSKGIVSNQVVAYFIGTVYKFYKNIGMSEKVRFKQCDVECWVAEIECSGGWKECTKISGKNDDGFEAKLNPIEVEGIVIIPDMDKLKLEFKNNSKKVAAALEAKGEEEIRKMMSDFESNKDYVFDVATIRRKVTIKPEMLQMKKQKKTVYERVPTYVAEVYFRIGRIVCCQYEHAYKCKEGKAATPLPVFSFPYTVAPYKCFVINNKKFEIATKRTKDSLKEARIRFLTVTQGNRAWKKLIQSDECGCPIAIRGNSEDTVMIRVQGSDNIIIVKVDDVVQPIEDILNEVCTWDDMCKKYTVDKNQVKPTGVKRRLT